MILKNKKIIIIGIIFIIISVFLILFLFIYNNQTVLIRVAPQNANILLDGKSISNNTRQWVKQGNHKVTISADGFETLEEDLLRQGEQDKEYLFCLKPKSGLANTLINNDDNRYICEALAGRNQKLLSQKLFKENPILYDLPFNEGLFSIGQGSSIKDINNPEKFALYVHYYNEQSLIDAKKWISDKTDIDKLEIVYTKDYYDDRKAGENIGYKYEDLKNNYPIIKDLPFRDPYYTISYRSTKADELKLVIYTPSPRYRYIALDQISALGYEKSDYEIQFVDFKNPLAENIK